MKVYYQIFSIRVRTMRIKNKIVLMLMCILILLLLSSGSFAYSLFETSRNQISGNQIDQFVTDQLETKGMAPANLSSDPVFVRRIYLDMIGRLPTSREVQRFLKSKDSDKRKALIDKLLLNESFPEYWAYKWSDLLRVKAEFPIKLWPNGVHAYYQWIYQALETNMPYDQFAQELLTSSGSNFRTPQVNFYRAVQGNSPSAIAQVVALTFMGSRIETWDEKDRAGMELFFSKMSFKGTAEWKEEIITWDFLNEDPIKTSFPDRQLVTISSESDPREVFSNWLTTKENPWFAKNISNRIWYWLMGQGIVHEPDDIKSGNLPVNPQLLSYLEKELIDADFNLQHLFRLILNSRTYQQSSIHKGENKNLEKYFAVYPVRRLEAEVLIDALCQVTGTKEIYSSSIPEPFTFVPKFKGAIGIADGSISNSFLDMFGRSSRDTGLVSERSNQPSRTQRMHLLNSSHIQKKITKGPKVRQLYRLGKKNPEKLIRLAYLNILSRYPTKDEISTIHSYASNEGLDAKEATADLVWALINSKEFLYRH